MTTVGFDETSYTVSGTFEENALILEVPVNNSGTYTADAYVYISASDPFLHKISNSYNGEYEGLEDNTLLALNDATSRFNFTIGNFDDTVIDENGYITLDNTSYIEDNYIWDPNGKCIFMTLYYSDITHIRNSTNQNAAARTVVSFDKGKWYWEISCVNNQQNFCGIGTINASIATGDYLGKDVYGWSIGQDGNIYNGTTVSAIGASLASMRVGVVLDLDNGKIWFSRDGVYENGGNPTAGTGAYFTNVSGTVFPMCSLSGINVGSPSAAYLYLEAADFIYDVPVGFNTTEVLINGYYTTPIVDYDNQLATSCLLVDDPINISDTIEIRSSNIKPLDLIELYWPGENGIRKYDVYLKKDTAWPVTEWAASDPYAISVDKINGNVAVNYGTTVRLYDRDGNQLYSYSDSKYQFDKRMEITKDGQAVWGYGETYGTLVKLNLNLSVIEYEKVYNNDRDDFIYDFSIEKNGNGIWYTNIKNKKLIHINSEGTEICSSSFHAPRAVATTSDNGCWVFNYGYKQFYRFQYYGSYVTSFTFDKDVDYIETDSDDSIWFISKDSVGHINLSGIQDKIITNLNNPERLLITTDYVYVYSSQGNMIVILNKSNLSIEHIFTLSEYTGKPAVLNINYEDQNSFANNVLPIVYDPVWGDDSTLEWLRIDKNNLILPNAKYHQIRMSFTNNESAIYSTMRKVYEAPIIKLSNIRPNNSKNIYIKTNNINNAMDHTLSLRVSWEEFSGR